jgi:hypothetical protein
MGAIELKMSILTGLVGGVLLILAELVLMHRGVAKYRAHLRGLHRAGRKMRLFAEVGGIVAVAMVQPVVISLLTVTALGSFNPQFSANATQQLEAGGQVKDRPLRSHNHPD